MIVIDTHIWVWWVHNLPELKAWMRECITAHEADRIGVSVISCWEIARLVAGGKLKLNHPVAVWFDTVLSAECYPGIELLPLTPGIAIDANNLPGTFHKDPADRIIVATARVFDCELLTADAQILAYSEVKHATPSP